jgi:hypothetical protein
LPGMLGLLQLSPPDMPVTQEPLPSSSCLQQEYHNAPHGAHRACHFHGTRLSVLAPLMDVQPLAISLISTAQPVAQGPLLCRRTRSCYSWNLSSLDSKATRTWLQDHPRLHQVIIPKEPAGSTSRKAGGDSIVVMRLPGQTEASAEEIERATIVATAQLNRRAKPWVWGHPPKTPRHRHSLQSAH